MLFLPLHVWLCVVHGLVVIAVAVVVSVSAVKLCRGDAAGCEVGMWAVAAGASAGCVLLSVVATVVLLNPLRALSRDAIRVAALDPETLAKTSDPPQYWTSLEDARLRHSLDAIKQHLVGFRSFVPVGLMQTTGPLSDGTGSASPRLDASSAWDDTMKTSVASVKDLSRPDLEPRRVCVLLFNLVGWHDMEHKAAVATHAAYLTTLLAECEGVCGSCTELLAGDRALVTLGATRTKKLAAKPLSALKLMVGVQEKWREAGIDTTVGAVNGSARVGTLGVTEMMRLCCVAPLLGHAATLERLARSVDGVRNAVDASWTSVLDHFASRRIAALNYRNSSSDTRVSEILYYYRRSEADWMYQLETNTMRASYDQWNRLMDAIDMQTGEVDPAQAYDAVPFDKLNLPSSLIDRAKHALTAPEDHVIHVLH